MVVLGQACRFLFFTLHSSFEADSRYACRLGTFWLVGHTVRWASKGDQSSKPLLRLFSRMLSNSVKCDFFLTKSKDVKHFRTTFSGSRIDCSTAVDHWGASFDWYQQFVYMIRSEPIYVYLRPMHFLLKSRISSQLTTRSHTKTLPMTHPWAQEHP